ncbi:MAG: hypothetical protein QG555_368 [Thermodesulfobacteriota bacterium]|nr:hypothetical protein [Thermodesulfobacteriota bacterium]
MGAGQRTGVITLRKQGFCINISIVIMILICLGACAAHNVPIEPPGILAARFQSDAALFQEGYAQLSGEDRPIDYGKARKAFELLITKYPQSKWRNYAKSFLFLMDETQTAREQEEKERQACIKIKALWEHTQKECHTDQLKTQDDLSRLRKENEQLNQENVLLWNENEQMKKNLEQLKRLEIELQRRDRAIR